jgi:uncharacterized protein (DUF433 family)
MYTSNELITRNPAIMNGKPVIVGTRITVELILKKLSEGATFNDIIKLYPHITNNQILATLDYAANIIGNEELLDV